ncbi:MAG: ShlB/FhaC/HecB family hemolysin secretion/activation protein [Sulfuritalea sp.]|nr:ShlB/FhaC/HecB family hemolysin secretion/activation protein [Sulfuritalea sp.]
MKRLLPLALFAATAAFAQQPPDAGQILRDTGPAPRLPAPKAPTTRVEEGAPLAAPDGQRIAVKGIRVTGATAFPEAELLALVADADGKELSLAELDGLAARITRHYREAGYLVARAYLPAQDVSSGTIEIAVLESRLGKVSVTDRVGLSASALAPLDALSPGQAIRRQEMEHSLLVLSDLPGVEVKSTLRPGAAVGTSDFLVDVAPGPAVSGSVDIDSFGNRFTGAHRFGASLFLNNPAKLGDQASLRLQKSDGDFDYVRVGYQLPVGVHATRIGVAWSQMHYGLGKDFAPLKASGEASVGSLYLLHPFLRSREASWYGQVQYDDKRVTDNVDATSTKTGKLLGNWTFGVNGNLTDSFGGGGSNTIALGYMRGHLELDATTDLIDAATARSAGGFAKWSASFQRLQHLTDGISLSLAYAGQWAGKNLDSSEKFALGGAHGVRAYPQGEASGDEGQSLTAELRWQVSDAWQAQAFYDDGRVKINRNPWAAGDNTRHLAGVGVGAAWTGGGFTARLFAAWKADTGKPTSDVDRSPRVWVQAAKYF